MAGPITNFNQQAMDMQMNYGNPGAYGQYGGQYGQYGQQGVFPGVPGSAQGILGTPGNGAVTGTVIGGIAGLILGGGNPLTGAFGAGIGAALGGLLGGYNQQQSQGNPNYNQLPPGQGYGPPFNGGYNPGFQPGQQGPYPGGYPQQAGYYPQQNPQQQAYQQGFQQGYQQGMQQHGCQQNPYQQGYQQNPYQQGFQPNPYQQGNQQNPYQQGFQPGAYPGTMPPGGSWNAGQNPQQMCYPPQMGSGNPGGHLSQEGEGKPVEYRTSGGWTVKVDKDKVIMTSPDGKSTVQQDGDPHERVNGQHVKDWENKQRSVVLPDGTKVTMTADGPQGVTRQTSIYDGDQNVQINNDKNQVSHRSFDPRDTRSREAWQYDGETAAITYNNKGGINYSNYYTQDENFGIKSNYKELASTENPQWWNFWDRGQGKTTVKDSYDDPRLAHT